MTDPIRQGYKILTHDYRPPLQEGDPVWDGKRKTLGKVTLDTGSDECAAGWNFCGDAHTALRIAGLWPDGRPSVLLRVQGSADTVERGEKRRCSNLKIVGVCTEEEIKEAVHILSEPFGEHQDRMVLSQMEWRQALSRPSLDEAAVESDLQAALTARGLEWSLKQFGSTAQAQRAWDTWTTRATSDTWATQTTSDTRATWAAWDTRATRTAWNTWATQATWDTWDTWTTRGAWDTWTTRATWDTWAARAGREGLTIEYAGLLQGWTEHDPLLLTTGIRDAHANGLAVAMPVGADTLGWAMVAP